MARRLTVAIMQPYFAPYAGYYRLLAGVDVFVLLDDVQFPRRGWVHRNRLPDAKGEAAWLTLPLAHAPFDAKIGELRFAEDAAARMAERRRGFPGLAAPGPEAETLLNAGPFEGGLVDYLERQIEAAQALFGLRCETLRASSLAVAPELKAQDRILALLARLGASDYLNAPGGRELYDAQSFSAAGVVLQFLAPWEGEYWSALHQLTREPATALAFEIFRQTPRADSSV